MKAEGVRVTRLATPISSYIGSKQRGAPFVPLQGCRIPHEGLASDHSILSRISMLPGTPWSNVGPNQRTQVS